MEESFYTAISKKITKYYPINDVNPYDNGSVW